MRSTFPNTTVKTLIAICIVFLISVPGTVMAYTIWSDDFSTDRGWGGYSNYDGEWNRAQAIGGMTCDGGSVDPTVDHSPGTDNYMIGNDIGGCYSHNLGQIYWVTSPVINARGFSNVQLSFWRYAGVERSQYDHVYVAVYNGSSWHFIWENDYYTSLNDTAWAFQTFDVSTYADNNPIFGIAFGIGSTDGSVRYSGWNIDDIKVEGSTAIGNVIDFIPTSFEVGETTNISVTIKNIGDATGTFELYGWAPDSNWALTGKSASYTLSPGEQRTITDHFWVTPNSQASSGSFIIKIYNIDKLQYDASLSKTVSAYQNDANSGTDAGDVFSSALSISEGSYTGYVDSGDTDDWYMLFASSGDRIDVVTTPPGAADFDLELYDPGNTLKDGSYNGGGTSDSVSFVTDSSGWWRVRVYRFSGEGKYSFTVDKIGSVSVSGDLKYRDNNNQDKDIKQVTVELWDDDSGGDGIDDLLGTTTTSDIGSYTFPAVLNEDSGDSGTLDLYIKIKASNGNIVEVVNASNDVYEANSTTSTNVPDGTKIIDHTITNQSIAGAYNIFNKIVEGHQYVDVYDSPPNQITVKWYPNYNPSPSNYDGNMIHLQGIVRDPDEWDTSVIVHEYGHYIMDTYADLNPPTVNYGGDGGHSWASDETPETAWIEGWPNFFQSAVKHYFNYPDYDVYYDWNNQNPLDYSLEDPASEGNPTTDDTEGAIASILWDIYDNSGSTNDEFWLGRSWELADGFTNIWDVFRTFDPDVNDNTHNHPWDVNEFWDGWFARNHNFEDRMWAIFFDRGINKDTAAPSSSVNSLPSTQSSTSFTVSWSGSDSGPSGTRWYDVQYKDGSSGTWTNWHTQTTSTSDSFNGANGHTYYFQSRAQDYAGNNETYPGGNGDTQTTVNTGGGGDSNPPDISFVSIVEGWITTVKDVLVSWVASDSESGINRFLVQLNSSPGTGWIDVGLNTSYTFYNTSDDNHTFYLKAVDNANNTAVEARNFTVNTSYVEPVTELQAEIHVFFPYGYNLQPNDAVSADIILINWNPEPVVDGIRVTVRDASGIVVYKTWKRVHLPAKDGDWIRFTDFKLPANAQSGIWMFHVEFTEDAKWTPPGFRYFIVN